MPRNEKVTRIIDGDTFETNMRRNSIRLANVDTPEKGQAGFGKAKQELKNLIQGQTVTIDPKARDKYARTVADVKIGNQSVNNKMKKFKKK